MMKKTFYFFPILITVFLSACQLDKPIPEECLKYSQELYLNEAVDSAMAKRAAVAVENYRKRFGEKPIKGLDQEAYQLMFYAVLDYGKSVKIEKIANRCSLSVKCLPKDEEFTDCDNYSIEIQLEEWNEFEKMIYEFDFWTDEPFRTVGGVMDGSIFFLEGNRPQAANCNKKVYQLSGRENIEFDKIRVLCNYIIKYERRLASRYERRITNQN